MLGEKGPGGIRIFSTYAPGPGAAAPGPGAAAAELC